VSPAEAASLMVNLMSSFCPELVEVPGVASPSCERRRGCQAGHHDHHARGP
jgi:hypothetical protein